MDATKLLGALLGNNATGGSLAGKVLGGLLKGQGGGGSGAGNILGAILGGGQPAPPRQQDAGGILGAILGGGSPRQQQHQGGGGGILGAILGNATKQHAERKGHSGGIGDVLGGLLGGPEPEPIPEPPAQAQDAATLLIRAMTNAAKSDGQLDETEQQNILGRLGEVSQQEVDFLRNEFNTPLDVDSFARSVPKELAGHAYTFSLLAIKLDQNKEAQYLGKLAQGLGIDAQTANGIHRQLGAPEIFS